MIKLKRGQTIKAMLKTKFSFGFMDFDKGEIIEITKGKNSDYAIKTIFGNRDLENDSITELPKMVCFSFLTYVKNELTNEMIVAKSNFTGTSIQASEYFAKKPNICCIKNLTKNVVYEKNKVL